MQTIRIVNVAILGTLGLFACKPSTTDAGGEQAAPAVVVPVADLVGDYKANEVRGDAKYKGKRVQVTGIVSDVKKDFTDNIKPLGKRFGLSQTSVHLRLAEVLGDDRALVTANQNHVMSRGDGWATVPVVGVAHGRVKRPDIAKATLRGGIDEGRIALRRR